MVSCIVQIEVAATDNVGVRPITVNAPGVNRRCDVYDSPQSGRCWFPPAPGLHTRIRSFWIVDPTRRPGVACQFLIAHLQHREPT